MSRNQNRVAVSGDCSLEQESNVQLVTSLDYLSSSDHTNEVRSSKSAAAQTSTKFLRPVPKVVAQTALDPPDSQDHSAVSWPLAVLCSLCESIFQSDQRAEWAAHQPRYNHHTDQHALSLAAESGCEICTLVLHKFSSHVLEYMDANDSHRQPKSAALVAFQFLVGRKDKPYIEIVSPRNSILKEAFNFKLHFDSPERSAKRQWTVSCPPRRTDSPESWKLCRHWLYLCRTTHERCGYHGDAYSFQPSRLIHVFLENGGLQAKLHCEPLKRHAPYLTLSHCWGLQRFFVLNQDNLPALQTNVPLERLARLMQDAVRATVELGFEFIWIDSLCIVQDSELDWLRESSQMGAIYKHSACTLAATGFRNGMHGMFVERNPAALRCPLVQTHWSGPFWNDALPRGEYFLVDSDIWRTDVEMAPLNQRGWVLQERLLSPCILHFGDRQIFWECFQSNNCETFPKSLPPVITDSLNFKAIAFYESEQHLPLYPTRAEHPSRNVYFSWQTIVETYSRTDLTYSRDKLVALSGVAKEVARISGDDYLAGLWREKLLADLLWSVNPEEPSSIGIPAPLRAPSWSWASLDVPVMYMLLMVDEEEYTVHCNVLDAVVFPRTEDETSMVKGGYIQMHGSVVQAAFLENNIYWWTMNGQRVHVMPYFDLDRTVKGRAHPLVRFESRKDDTVHASFRYDFSAKVLSHRPFYLLPVVSRKHILWGLILSPTGVQRGEFIRVGLLHIQAAQTTKVLLTPAERLPIEAYEECDESSELLRYTIKIL